MAFPFFTFDTYYLLSALILAFGVQIFFFGIAFFFKTDRLTDLVYGLTFVLLAVLYLLQPEDLARRSVWMALAVVLWGTRLALYLFVRIMSIKRDRRFDGRREKFWSFAAFWGLQGSAIWMAMLPLTLVVSRADQPTIGWLDFVGFGLFVLGLLIESVADQQKFVFRSNPANEGRWTNVGLWRYSRFPNYFGEILLWWGLFLVSLSALPPWAWLVSACGPAFITFILLRVSGIPLLELAHLQKYGHDREFQRYRQQTSLLVPWFPAEK